MDSDLHLTILVLDIAMRISAFALIFVAVHSSFKSSKLPRLSNSHSHGAPRAICENRARAALPSSARTNCATSKDH
jgi:hypothetical protein